MALMFVMTSIALVTTLGSALVLNTMAETSIAAAYREGVELFYAADGAAGYVLHSFAADPDWQLRIDDGLPSSFNDGPPSGQRRVGSITLELTQMTANVNQRAGPVGQPFRLYAYGPLADMSGGGETRSVPYIAAWLADFTPETADESGPDRLVAIVATAFGPTGGRRSVILTAGLRVNEDDDNRAAITLRSWNEFP